MEQEMKLQPINTLESGINVGATFTNLKKRKNIPVAGKF